MFQGTRGQFWGDVALVASGLVLVGALLFRHGNFFHDDAFISLRYAVNLAETGRPHWNPGEWVEGYTSLLHIASTTLPIKLGVDPVLAVRLVNFVAALATVILVVVASRMAGLTRLVDRLPVVVTFAALPCVALWVLGGLEAIMATALLFGGLVCLQADLRAPGLRNLVLAALLFSLAILTRLDTAVFIAGSGLAVLLVRPGTFLQRVIAAAIVAGVPAAVSVVQILVRLRLYGEVFPLTFYAKTDLPLALRMENGLFYLIVSNINAPIILIAVALALHSVLSGRIRPAVVLLALPIVFHALYLLWAGGDHMPAGRMLLPMVPAATLLMAVTAGGFAQDRRGVVLWSAAALSLVLAAVRPAQQMDAAAFVGGIVGRHISEQWPQDITIALNTAGSTPFFARQNRTFIDMLGLNDPVIAKRENVPLVTPRQDWPGHSKGDGAYVLGRKPDRIILGPAEGVEAADAWFLSGYEIANDPEFARCYQMSLEEIPYDAETASRGPARRNPLQLTYYHRVCD